MPHTIEVTLDDTLIRKRDLAELKESVKHGLILFDYLGAKISMGRFAELMGMGTEQARDWLHDRGIATLRRLRDPDLESACEKEYRDLAGHLGIELPDP